MTTVADLIGADGAAGDPQALRRSAEEIERAGESIERLRVRLAAVDGMAWQGRARARYDKLRDRTVQGDLAPFAPAYDAVSQTLRRYAGQLTDIQARARALARQLTDAQLRVGAHQRDAQLADFGVSLAKGAATASTLTPLTRPAAELALREAKAHRARMQTQLAESRRHVARLRAQGADLRAELDRAAGECAAAVDGLQPPGGSMLQASAAVATAVGVVKGNGGAARRPNGRGGSRGSALRPRSFDLGPGPAQRQQWNATPAITARDFARQHDKTYMDYDRLYGNQCVDVFSYYNRDIVGGPRLGCESAYQLYDLYGSTSSYSKVPPSATATDGDVAIFGPSIGGGHGHVAIVIEDRGDTLYVFHQNWPQGSEAHYQEIKKSALLGYLRPQTHA